jgi:glycosyltransferase A (GT-A) superfamily protein (DUF2064 family)
VTSAIHLLVVAKAPQAGRAKTRLATDLGDEVAADLAAASLLDTITAVEGTAAPGARLCALSGDLARAERGDQLAERLAGWQLVTQQGETFADRLVHAHRAAAALWGELSLVVQLGMDTPQVTRHDVAALASAAAAGGVRGCGLGPAVDGGWWGLAMMSAGYADALAGVPMSRPQTGQLTADALRRAGAIVGAAHELRDVDTLEDAVVVASRFPELGFSAAFAAAVGDRVA